MRHRLLGRSGIRVSEVCLGTMTFGDDWGWGAPRDTCGRILDLFAEAGGNFVDTADKYTDGASEAILGELLEGRRDRFVLASKYTLETDGDDLNSAGNHRKNLVASLEASLRRLRTDRLDVLWVHARDDWTPVPEVMRALDDQVRAGKVLHVGVSDWPAWEVSAANTLAELRGWSPFVALQIEHSLLERTPERDLLPMAHAFDLAVTAWSPLAAGLLTGKHAGGGAHGRAAGRATDQRADAVIAEVVAVARELGAEPSQVALAWLLQRAAPGVIPILGATREEQMRQNLGCLELVLEPEHVERLDLVSAVGLGFPHDFLRRDAVRRTVYGARHADVDVTARDQASRR
jgi:aryl-alcohol dehydrogenase-like predicted oxidoreductase